MPSSNRKSKAASVKKGASDLSKQPSLDFEPFSVVVKEMLTSIYLISCQEENVVLAALISLDRFAAKSTFNVEFLLENGLNPQSLLVMAFKKDALQPTSQARTIAAKLLTRFVKIPKVRDSLEEGTVHCLACLERNESEVMNEYASNILGELTIGTSVSYAAALLIDPVTCKQYPLKILFACLASSKDPDVIHNCLRNIWQLLIAASATPDRRQYTDIINDNATMEIIPSLFTSDYPAIQILAMAVSYEAAVRSSAAHGLLTSSFPTLLELLESPSDRLLHCTILALIRRLVMPPPKDSAEESSKTKMPKDQALNFVAIEGPQRLLEYARVHSMEPGDVRFWSMAALLALYSSPSAAEALVDRQRHHSEVPPLVREKDSNVAVSAATAVTRILQLGRAEVAREFCNSSLPRDLAALSARWPSDESIPARLRQTFEGCAIAATVLKDVVLRNVHARKALVYGEQSDVREASSGDSPGNINSQKTATAPISTSKVTDAVEYLREALERVGKLPEDCTTSVLATVTAVASIGDLRPPLSGNHGLVLAVSNCLDARSYCPPEAPAVELPASWPETSDGLERMVASRLTKERMWLPKNPAPELGDPLLAVKESACLALGVLMLEAPATETFVQNHGADKIRQLLEREERGFGRNSLLEAVLALVAHCPSLLANALVSNGTLSWMMNEAASSRHVPYSAQWNAAIASLLRSNPSAKFQATGRLNPEDSTGDLFYVVCPSPGRFYALPSLAEFLEIPPEPHRRVFVASWAPSTSSSASQSCQALKFGWKTAKKTGKNSRERSEVLATEYDEDLRDWEASLRRESQEGDLGGIRGMVDVLAKHVWEVMAGPLKEGGFDKERHLEQLKIELGRGDVVPLGMIRTGGHTERAILFKVLADRLGLPVALVRGPYGRCWVEVAVVEVAEKETAVEQLLGSGEETEVAAVPRHSRSKDVGSSKGRESFGGDSTEKRKRSQDRTKEGRKEREASGVSSPAPYVPQAILNIPLSVIKPNHVIDLISPDCRMYPIGSYEANVYCGFATCNYDAGIDPQWYLDILDSDQEKRAREVEDEGLYLTIR